MSSITTTSHSLIYYRLVAIWILCEAMLGGIIHGFKIPVSGLVVGSSAVICICLIAWYVPAKGAIIRATIIVAIFKMMLSPQAPPPAYIAVFFQGLMGELLFWNRKYFRLSCILLAVLSLLESGLQRILVLTIVYGNDLWVVINNFFNNLTKQKTTTNYSLWIGGGYVVLHFITGLFVGWWASTLPEKVRVWSSSRNYRLIPAEVATDTIKPTSKKKRRKRTWLLIIWILLLLLYIQSYFKIGTPILPSHISLKILLRSVIIVFAWIFLVGPLLKQLLHGWLQKRQKKFSVEIRKIIGLLPATQQLVVQSWKQSAHLKGLKRIKQSTRLILVNALANESRNVVILTGPVQTGKTTSIMEWARGRNNVFGILTPVVDGKRVFMDINKGTQSRMEALDNEPTYDVGRFRFSKTNFDEAIGVIRQGINEDGWLVIDEIGPLELRGEGFSDVLQEVLNSRESNLLLVVRDKDDVLHKVIEAFNLNQAVVIRHIGELTQLKRGESYNLSTVR